LIDKKELSLLEREIDIMKKLQHANIIQLMEVVDTPQTLYLVLEFAGGGELFDAIVKKGQYSEPDAINIVKQILEAVQYIHDNGIAHRDLKVFRSSYLFAFFSSISFFLNFVFPSTY
jgi:serine/threonine protein kinase